MGEKPVTIILFLTFILILQNDSIVQYSIVQYSTNIFSLMALLFIIFPEWGKGSAPLGDLKN